MSSEADNLQGNTLDNMSEYMTGTTEGCWGSRVTETGSNNK